MEPIWQRRHHHRGLNYRQPRFVSTKRPRRTRRPRSPRSPRSPRRASIRDPLPVAQRGYGYGADCAKAKGRCEGCLSESCHDICFFSRLAFIMQLGMEEPPAHRQVGLISPAFKSWLIFSIINIVCKYVCGAECMCLCCSSSSSVSVCDASVIFQSVPVCCTLHAAGCTPPILLLLLPLVAFN